MVDLGPYLEAVLEARRLGLSLGVEQERALLALLDDYADELASLVESGLASGAQVSVYNQVARLTAELTREIRKNVAAGVRLTVERVGAIHSRITLDLLRAARLPTEAVAAAYHGTGTRALAVLARPQLAGTMASIRMECTARANGIIRRGVARGVTPGVIGRELRMAVGAPGSLVEGDAALLGDLRRIGYDTITELGYEPTRENLLQVRGEAGSVARRARLVGRQEAVNAEHEVHAASVEVSPVVKAVKTAVSGRHPRPDQCDAAAAADLYGLGPGCYPPEKMPARWHVRCICSFTHVLRPMAEWSVPRPSPPALNADWSRIATTHALAPSEVRSMRAAIAVGERRWDHATRRAAA